MSDDRIERWPDRTKVSALSRDFVLVGLTPGRDARKKRDMWKFVTVASLAGGGAAICLLAARLASTRRVRYSQILREWRDGKTWTMANAFEGVGQSADPQTTAMRLYLAGVSLLQAGRVKEAARAFGAAHHSNPHLETAALLTFACLKAKEGEDTDLLEQVVQTWQEMKSPDVVAHAPDRLIVELLTDVKGCSTSLSPLGRLAWGVLPPSQQARMAQLLNDATCRWVDPLRE